MGRKRERAIRSDNGPEFVDKTVQGWIAAVGARTGSIAPGSPWENGYTGLLNGRLRDELLTGEIFCRLQGRGAHRRLAPAPVTARATPLPVETQDRHPRRRVCNASPLGPQ